MLLLLAVGCELLLGGLQPVLNVDDIVADLLELRSLVLGVRDHLLDFILSTGDFGGDLISLFLDLLDQLISVLDNVFGLHHLFIKKGFLEGLVLLLEELHILRGLKEHLLQRRQTSNESILLLLVPLDAVQLEGQGVLVDNRLVNSYELALELVVVGSQGTGLVAGVAQTEVHLFLVEVWILVVEFLVDDAVGLVQGLHRDVALQGAQVERV
mmetsp:Transcript_21886/g.33967  ORF Transcript_21886/g.33967 Transcript_21886/m.33967 type:complete len:212 (+) Transcript_21886:4477-5112(+)